jgi:hypothetical protein
MSAFMPWRRDTRRDVDDELRFHFDARIADLMAQGLTVEAARERAVREFGNVDDVAATLKAIDDRVAANRQRADVLDGIRYDLRHAARSLWRTPAVSITIIVTLALGLGVNTAMFSLLDAILFRPPAGVSDPGQVRRLWSLRKFSSGQQFWSGYDYLTYSAVEEALRGRAELAVYHGPEAFPLGRTEEPPDVNVAAANAAFFRVLGVRPVRGRIYGPDEDGVDVSANVTVISDRFWRREFNADPGVVGQVVEFNQKPYTVIGVTPPDFSGVDLGEAEAWVPLRSNPSYSPRAQASWSREPNINGFQILMRLPPGAFEELRSRSGFGAGRGRCSRRAATARSSTWSSSLPKNEPSRPAIRCSASGWVSRRFATARSISAVEP